MASLTSQFSVDCRDGLQTTTGQRPVSVVARRPTCLNASVVAVCAALESEIAELDNAEKEEFLASMNLEEPGLRPARKLWVLIRLNIEVG